MDPVKGLGWTAKKANQVERKYKNFLRLIALGKTCVPTIDVDMIWHEHILRTKKYYRECMEIFGRFIHHDPDIKPDDLDRACEETNKSYEALFGEKYSSPKKGSRK
jgi:hypothetical protein